MINVGQNNKWALVQCLREEFERQIEQMPEVMIHNFTKKDQFFEFPLKVHAEKFHRVVLQEENEALKIRLERLGNRQAIEKEIEQGILPKEWHTFHHAECGKKYRGCHPTKCPKNQYEKTGIWELNW